MKTEEQIRAQVMRCLQKNNHMRDALWPLCRQPRWAQLMRRHYHLCTILDRLDGEEIEPTIEQRLRVLGY